MVAICNDKPIQDGGVSHILCHNNSGGIVAVKGGWVGFPITCFQGPAGLGKAEQVDVKLQFPISGKVVKIKNVTANQTLEIKEE